MLKCFPSIYDVKGRSFGQRNLPSLSLPSPSPLVKISDRAIEKQGKSWKGYVIAASLL